MATFGNLVQEPVDVTCAAWWACQYNVAEAGTVTSITVYFAVYNAGKHCHVGIYTDTGADYPNALLGETGEWDPGAAGWQTINVNIPFSAGKIWIVFAGVDSNIKFKYHFNVRDQALKTVLKTVVGSYGAMPANYPAGATEYQHDFSLYATYTLAAGLTGQKMELTLCL